MLISLHCSCTDFTRQFSTTGYGSNLSTVSHGLHNAPFISDLVKGGKRDCVEWKKCSENITIVLHRSGFSEDYVVQMPLLCTRFKCFLQATVPSHTNSPSTVIPLVEYLKRNCGPIKEAHCTHHCTITLVKADVLHCSHTFSHSSSSITPIACATDSTNSASCWMT